MAKISFSELVNKVSSGKLTEQEIQTYFKIDAIKTRSFDPCFRIDYGAVDVTGVEQSAAAAGHALAIEAGQNAKAGLKSTAVPPDGTYVAEGDSWFKLPDLIYPPTMIDFLKEKYPINNLAHWGDTIQQMVDAKQYLPYLQTKAVKFLLFSGGGNDLLGDQLEQSLKIYDIGHKNASDAQWYLTNVFYDQLDKVMSNYAILISQVQKFSPSTNIVAHGYDYARPQENGPYLGIHFMKRGLHPRDHKDLCLAIVKTMVDMFNNRLSHLASHYKFFKYVDLRGTIQDTEWFDGELHPNRTAAERLASKMAVALGVHPVKSAAATGS